MISEDLSIVQFIETNGLNAGSTGFEQKISPSDQPRASIVRTGIMDTMERTLSSCKNPFPSSQGRGGSHIYNNPPFILE